MQSRSLAAAAIQSATFPELESVFLDGRKKITWLGRSVEGHFSETPISTWDFSPFPRWLPVTLGSKQQSVYFDFLLFIKKYYISGDEYIFLYESQAI